MLQVFSVLACSLIFWGGAVFAKDPLSGLAMAAIGGGWLGIINATLEHALREARRDRYTETEGSSS